MQADRYFTVAKLIVEDLFAGTRITRAALRDCMASVFGMTDADGAWSMREAYDVLETAQLLHVRNPRSAFARATTPVDALSSLLNLAALLPTETYRSEKQIALQQFSTPMPLAWLAARAARITSADTVLEPSAGTGLLAVHVAHAGARLLLNEIDELRAGLLGFCLAQHGSRHDAAHIDVVLRGIATPDVVLINPPFARSLRRSRDRHAAARHLRSAPIALRPSGRCVAIMPANFRPDGRHGTAWQSVAEIAGPRAILDFGDGAFAAHGTSVAIRMMVFDKGWTGEPVIEAVEDFASALLLVDAFPPRLDPPPARPTPVIPVLRGGPGGSWFRGSASTLVTPRAAQPPSDDVVAIDYVSRVDVAPVEAPVGLYAPWRLSRIRLTEARPHPDALVESIAMASVPPPVPTYRPMLPRRLLPLCPKRSSKPSSSRATPSSATCRGGSHPMQRAIFSARMPPGPPTAPASSLATAPASARAAKWPPASWTNGAAAGRRPSGSRRAPL
jgi:predicted RNA methylase